MYKRKRHKVKLLTQNNEINERNGRKRMSKKKK